MSVSKIFLKVSEKNDLFIDCMEYLITNSLKKGFF